MSTHSCVLAPHLKSDLAAVADGKYGRMFSGLPCYQADETALLALGRAHATIDSLLEPDTAGVATDNPHIPAGFPIFGQFIAHDITADRSLLQHHASLGELRNFRSPRLDWAAILPICRAAVYPGRVRRRGVSFRAQPDPGALPAE